MKRAFALVLFVAIASACSQSDSSPTSPDTTPTRTLSIAGDLNFGAVPLGQSKNAGFTIANSGNSPLTITGMTGPCASTGVFKFSWTSGTIAPGAAQSVIATFTPRVPMGCNGTAVLFGDHTSGTDTIPVIAVSIPGPPLPS
jgi:hypothetical protein